MDYIDLFQLVAPADYSMRPEARNDKATILRFIVDFNLGRSVTTDIASGQTRVLWSAAIITMGDEAVENQFANDVIDFALFPTAAYTVGTWEQRVRMNILQFAGVHEYFQVISPGTAPNPATGDGNQSGTIFNETGPREHHFDSSQKRRIARDESLWLLIQAFDPVIQDPNFITYDVTGRVLIAD